jgi:hypothetical protein
LDTVKIDRQQIDLLALLIRAEREKFSTVVEILCGEAPVFVVELLAKPLFDVVRGDRCVSSAFWAGELAIINLSILNEVCHMSDSTVNSGPVVTVICDCVSNDAVVISYRAHELRPASQGIFRLQLLDTLQPAQITENRLIKVWLVALRASKLIQPCELKASFSSYLRYEALLRTNHIISSQHNLMIRAKGLKLDLLASFKSVDLVRVENYLDSSFVDPA